MTLRTDLFVTFLFREACSSRNGKCLNGCHERAISFECGRQQSVPKAPLRPRPRLHLSIDWRLRHLTGRHPIVAGKDVSRFLLTLVFRRRVLSLRGLSCYMTCIIPYLRIMEYRRTPAFLPLTGGTPISHLQSSVPMYVACGTYRLLPHCQRVSKACRVTFLQSTLKCRVWVWEHELGFWRGPLIVRR